MPQAPCTVTALGMFDGVHLGHRKILRYTVDLARSLACTSAVFTFLEHPVMVLQPERAPALLTSAMRRAAQFDLCDIERVEMVPFDLEFSRQSPAEFVREIVVGRMQARAVVVGFNYHFGHRRAGTPEVLRELGREHGFDVHVVGPVIAGGEPISSSRIRSLIRAGEVAGAAELLGRAVRTEGVVIEGLGLARTIGYPTANIYIDEHLVLPGLGVYAVSVPAGQLGPDEIEGIAYHGRRPTKVSEHGPLDPAVLARLLEVHLFDWSGDLIGQRVQVDLHDKIRDDMRFDGVEGLVAQLERDVVQARDILRRRAAGAGQTV